MILAWLIKLLQMNMMMKKIKNILSKILYLLSYQQHGEGSNVWTFKQACDVDPVALGGQERSIHITDWVIMSRSSLSAPKCLMQD